jgi:hypothetical protein
MAMAPNPLNDMTVLDYINQFDLEIDEIDSITFNSDRVLHEIIKRNRDASGKLPPEIGAEILSGTDLEGVGPQYKLLDNDSDDEDGDSYYTSGIKFSLGKLNVKLDHGLYYSIMKILGILKLHETGKLKFPPTNEKILQLKVGLMKLVDEMYMVLKKLTKAAVIVYGKQPSKEEAAERQSSHRSYDPILPDEGQNEILGRFIQQLANEVPPWEVDGGELYSDDGYLSRLLKIAEEKYRKEVMLRKPLSKDTLKSLATAAGGIGVGALGTYGVMSGGRKSKKRKSKKRKYKKHKSTKRKR